MNCKQCHWPMVEIPTIDTKEYEVMGRNFFACPQCDYTLYAMLSPDPDPSWSKLNDS